MYFHPEVGGMESHILHLAEELLDRGHRVTLVTSRSIRGTKKREVIGKIDVHRITLPFRNPLGWILFVILSLPRFCRLAASHDILHCHSFASALAGALAKRKNRPLVVTIHTSHFNRLSRKKILRPFLRVMLNRADFIITASQELATLGGAVVPGKDFKPMPNAVSLRHFKDIGESESTVDNRLRLFYSGHLREVKGVDILIRALPLLSFDWELLVVGDGSAKEKLINLATSLGVIDKISFVGMVPHESMPEYIGKADLIVIPSRIEATSIAALEAMACRRIVVASNTGGLPEIVKEEWGYLFQTGDHEDLASVLSRAYRERGRFAEMGKKAAYFVHSNYSTEHQCDIHERMYRDLLGENALCPQ
jgi:glycosyltransferase involved in cell wall biosynthesis